MKNQAPSAAWSAERRLAGLQRFAMAITLLNVLGHACLGFEAPLAAALVSLAVAMCLELGLETLDARARGRRPCYAEGRRELLSLLLPGYVGALAIGMLLYAGDRLWPIAFAAGAAIASKALLRAPARGGPRHFLNPSNFGIALTLLLFPSVGIAPPYQFGAGPQGAWDWLLPCVIVCSGSFLNARFTRKLPLIAAWLAGFALQALVRTWAGHAQLAAALAPMSGVAFLLYTFYMATDPATTPQGPRAQVAFGLGLAATYGLLTELHVVFGLFHALVLVCALRGAWLWALAVLPVLSPARAALRSHAAAAFQAGHAGHTGHAGHAGRAGHASRARESAPRPALAAARLS